MLSMLPLLLVALGSATLVVMRDGPVPLGALLLHWVGLVWLGAANTSTWQTPAVEGTTAVTCIAVMAVTWRTLRIQRAQTATVASEVPPGGRRRRFNLADQLWPFAVVLVAGIGGVGLSRIYSLGADEQTMLAFYWTVLAGAMSLVLDGARSPVQLAVGMLTLLNGAALLTYALHVGTVGPAALGMMAISRVALAAILAYSWVVLKVHYQDLNLDTLFNFRAPGSMALALVEPHEPSPRDDENPGSAPAPDIEAEISDAGSSSIEPGPLTPGTNE